MHRGYFSFCLLLAHCAPAIHTAPPENIEATYMLSGWPQNRVDVVVTDVRPPDQKTGDATGLVKKLFTQAMSPPIMNAGEKTSLALKVAEIVARRENDRWKASVTIDAELTDTWGKSLRKVKGSGTFEKADISGTRTAQQCIDEAFRAAVVSMLRELDVAPLP